MSTEREMELSILLEEHSFVTNQMHARMNVVSSLIRISASFYIATLGLLIVAFSEVKVDPSDWLLALATCPFFILAILIAREDNLMQDHDYYYRRLRYFILDTINHTPEDSELLRFLVGMNDRKVGLFSKFGSVARYFFPILGIVTLVLAGYMLDGSNSKYLLNTTATFFIVSIVLILREINRKNKKNYKDTQPLPKTKK